MKPLTIAVPLLIGLICSAQTFASEGAAGPDQSICGTAAALAADPLASGESGSWSVVSGTAVFADQTNPLTQVTGLALGDNVLRWTLVSNGLPEVDEVVITVFDPAATIALAGPDSVLCLQIDTMHLVAQPPSLPAIGSWSSVGIALVDVFTDPHSFVEFPSGGTAQMIWTVFNGTCGQVSDTAIINVQACIIGVEEQPTQAGVILLFDAASRTLLLRNVPASARAEIIDQAGRSVMSHTVRASAEARVPLTGLRPGTYLVQVIAEGAKHVLRIAIDR